MELDKKWETKAYKIAYKFESLPVHAENDFVEILLQFATDVLTDYKKNENTKTN